MRGRGAEDLGGEGGVEWSPHVMNGRVRMIIDARLPTMSGRTD